MTLFRTECPVRDAYKCPQKSHKKSLFLSLFLFLSCTPLILHTRVKLLSSCKLEPRYIGIYLSVPYVTAL